MRRVRIAAVLIELALAASSASAARLSGSIRVPAGDQLPREVLATVLSEPEKPSARCEIAGDGTFVCELLQQRADMRLEVEGFAPLYLWDVALPVRIVPWMLVRGGSVAGWTNGARIRAAPVTYGSVSDEVRLRMLTGTPNARGFFQLTGVPAGEWIVVAESPGASPSAALRVAVDDHHESALPDPLDVQPLTSAALTIVPPVDGAGKPWQVRLARRDPLSNTLQPFRAETASADGTWTASRIEAGLYVISIASGTTIFHRRQLEISGDTRPLVLVIDAVPVRGRLRVGQRPTPGELKFSNADGSRATAVANDDGDFTALLPAAGEWDIDVRLRGGQEVRAKPREIRRRDGEESARTDVELPGGRVTGYVVDEDGTRVPAGVIMTRNGGPIADVLAQNGVFELAGIDGGPATIEAQAKGAASGPVPVEVSESTSPVTLVLRRVRKVAGWLTTRDGEPVAGASIRYWTAASSFLGQTVSSPSGRFELTITGDPGTVGLAIVSPAFGAKLLELGVPAAGERVDVTMSGTSGRVLIRGQSEESSWPVIGHRGVWTSLVRMLPPVYGGASPPWLTAEGIVVDLEPGEYTLCAGSNRSDCVTHVVVSGTTVIVTLPAQHQD